jgi:hypothetical protein
MHNLAGIAGAVKYSFIPYWPAQPCLSSASVPQADTKSPKSDRLQGALARIRELPEIIYGEIFLLCEPPTPYQTSNDL